MSPAVDRLTLIAAEYNRDGQHDFELHVSLP
jgi:hypothetical protein